MKPRVITSVSVKMKKSATKMRPKPKATRLSRSSKSRCMKIRATSEALTVATSIAMTVVIEPKSNCAIQTVTTVRTSSAPKTAR